MGLVHVGFERLRDDALDRVRDELVRLQYRHQNHHRGLRRHLAMYRAPLGAVASGARRARVLQPPETSLNA